jgi:hypothetical protein
VAPIESTWRVSTDADGNAHYTHELFQSGPWCNYVCDVAASSYIHVAPPVPSVRGRGLLQSLLDAMDPTAPGAQDRLSSAVQQNAAAYAAAIGRAPIKVANDRQAFLRHAAQFESQVALWNAQAQLHTPTGAVRIDSVEPAEAEESFNLVVADAHDYFVGPRALLVHDNSPHQPTRMAIPGLPR